MSTGTSVTDPLSRAHAALLKDLGKLEEAASPSLGKGLAELRARLGATQAHIAEHFRFEEESGYMDKVRKREPRLERTIQQLAEEHRQLTQSLDMIVGEARAAGSLDDTLREEVRKWIERVRQHENRENDLVQDAFNLDISAED